MRSPQAITASIAFASILLVASVAQGKGNVRDNRSLSASERSSLPDTTQVSVGGHVVTLAELRRFHAQRQRASANAAAYGRTFAALLTRQPRNGPTLAPAPPPPGTLSSKSRAATESSKRQATLANQLGPHGPVIPIPDAKIAAYAKDYQDFCKAAQATSCLYFPVRGAWQDNVSGNDDYYTLTVVDPYIMDAALCAADNGTLSPDGCVYRYPRRLIVNFQPSPDHHFESAKHCPIDPGYVAATTYSTGEWEAIVDQHGAAVTQFKPAHIWPWWLWEGHAAFKSIYKPAACVVQVFSEV